MWVSTQTEVISYSVPDFRICDYFSLPCFNDLHHVTPTLRGTLLVASTGLDMVFEMTPQGELMREWEVSGSAPWARFSREIDYRKIASTKPHDAHPNYVFGLGKDLWVTRCDKSDAVCLSDMGRRIGLNVKYPHDGRVLGDLLYFSASTGHVVIHDWTRDQAPAIIDLTPIFNRRLRQPLGWWRGLAVLSDERIVVGFSRTRQSKMREQITWVRDRVGVLLSESHAPWYPTPTRIACINTRRALVEWEVDLEPAGMNAVYSIHDSNTPDPIPA